MKKVYLLYCFSQGYNGSCIPVLLAASLNKEVVKNWADENNYSIMKDTKKVGCDNHTAYIEKQDLI